MRKAKSLYINRYQEYDKVKEQALKAESEIAMQSASTGAATAKSESKVEKRKKQEDDALQKVNSGSWLLSVVW